MVKHNKQWGTVCDDYLSPTDYPSSNYNSTRSAQTAKSACRTLGLSGGSIETYEYTGSEPFMMDDVNCASNTANFLECSQKGWGKHDCGSHDYPEHVLLTCT